MKWWAALRCLRSVRPAPVDEKETLGVGRGRQAACAAVAFQRLDEALRLGLAGTAGGGPGMDRFTKPAWEAVSPLLDELLALGPDRCPARLAEIRLKDAGLADELASLLSEQSAVRREAFLEGGALDGQDALTLEGQTIGQYTLERPLAQGGMGAVWLARRSDGRFEGKVAVKFPNLSLLGGSGARRF